MAKELQALYRDVYVEYVTKNALQTTGEVINNSLFATHLNRFVRTLPAFKTDV